MRRVVAGTGALGAVLAFGGSVVALLGSGEPGAELARGLGAMGMSVVGLAGALAAGVRLRTGAVLMGASAVGGVLLEPELYLVGGVLLAAAVAVAVLVGAAEA